MLKLKYARLKKLLKKINPDIVISFINNETLYSIKKYKFIYSLRNDPNHVNNGFLERNIRNYLYKNSKAIVFQTFEAKNYFSDKIRQKGIIILNPIEVEKLGVWSGVESKTFVTACRLNSQKNLPMLIKAFKQLHLDYPDYKLEIYGKGEEFETLNEMVKEIDYIKLMGYSSNIHKVMENSFSFVLSSDYEGLSNSMLEALCIGIPSICTDCPPGGARMVITDGINGYLTNVNDAAMMYNKMKYLIEHKIELNDVSLNAINIRNDVSSEKVCLKWFELVNSLL